MDRATGIIRRASIAAVLGALFVVGNVQAESAHKENPAASPAERPYGMVPHKINIGPYDPGIALSKKTSPFYPSRASTGGRKVTISMFDPPEVCGGCHTEIYKQWKGSMHSNAWVDPIYRAALNHVSQTSGGKVDELCMGCHTPIGVVTGEANPAGTGMSAIANRGVQCDFCHNVSDTHGVGNGAYIVTPKLHGRRLKFGPFKDAKSPYHDTAYSVLHTRSEFCGQCHNVTHPFNRMPIERTYSEWKDSSYAGQGIQCQDCHMPPTAMKLTPFSKKRPKVYQHFFVGGNALVTKLLGADSHAAIARQMLKKAATVEIHAPKSVAPGGLANIVVKVTNVGAGHKLPTGFPEGREMWLDLKVTDKNGHTIYRLGQIKNGRTEPNTKTFKVTLGDKNGNPVDLELLQADRILSDTRIPAKGSSNVEYAFMVDPGAQGPLHIVADLDYWSVSPGWIKQIMGDKAPAVPIIKMASAQAKMDLRPSTKSVDKGGRSGTQRSTRAADGKGLAEAVSKTKRTPAS